MTLKRLAYMGVAAVVLAALLYVWLGMNGDGPLYKTAAVERGEIVQKVLATGTVNPVTLVQVGSQVSGRIAHIYVDFNSPVKQGQVVAQIDPALFEADVAKAKANYQTALAAVEKWKSQVYETERQNRRMQAVGKRDLVAQADVDQAQQAYETAQAELAGARATVGQTRAALDLAETNLRYSTIRSPVDGVVVERAVDEGQTVAASFQAPVMFKIAADLSKMQVDTNVDEADIGRVRLGQRASFYVDAYPGQDFAGTVAQVRNAPQTLQNVVTYDVVINVDNRELKLKPGMTANVEIATARKKDVLMVPNAALRFTPRPAEGEEEEKAPPAAPTAKGKGQQRVFVLDPGNKPRPVSVRVGISDGTSSELVSGKLAAGQKVIVEQIDAGDKKSATPGMGRPF